MKVLDITEKLSFDGKPKIKVKDYEIEINNDAITVLSIMELLGDDASSQDMARAAKILFGEEGYKKIAELKLSFKDFNVLLDAAIELATGDETTGE